ncbi:hypothetical protein MRX96_040023 [Rhipicephalus microplus]
MGDFKRPTVQNTRGREETPGTTEQEPPPQSSRQLRSEWEQLATCGATYGAQCTQKERENKRTNNGQEKRQTRKTTTEREGANIRLCRDTKQGGKQKKRHGREQQQQRRVYA